MGNPDFGWVVPFPNTTYITPLPFISFPIRIHMCPLGPHRNSFHLGSTLGQAWNDAPEVDVSKKKIKSIIWPLSTWNVPQNTKDGLDIQI